MLLKKTVIFMREYEMSAMKERVVLIVFVLSEYENSVMKYLG